MRHVCSSSPPAPAFEQEPDAPFGFVIQFLIIFMLATSSTRPEMISVTRATPLVRPCCPWDGASTTALFQGQTLLALKSLRPQQGIEQVTQQAGSDEGGE